MYDDALPVTGAGAMLLGGHAIGLPTIVLIAVGLMVTGLFAYRFATRGRRAALRR